jgi:ABC-type sugar transport system permease subunit
LLTQGGPENATMTLPLLIRYLGFDYLDIGKASAVAIIMVILLLILAKGLFSLYHRAEASLQ